MSETFSLLFTSKDIKKKIQENKENCVFQDKEKKKKNSISHVRWDGR